MKITACSIVKNEAQNIARSIESYKSAVDEIIIVDTGSTDNTVEVCKAQGAKTLFYEWNNNFAAAKNFALEHARGDWIIFLDADEWFVPRINRKTIVNLLRQISNVADGLMTTMCQYNEKSDKVFARELATRIFRNSPRIRYRGKIHERIQSNDNEITQAHCPYIEIFHSGYANELEVNKTQRNLDILYNEYKEGRMNTYLYFYIFRENYILGNVDQAIKFYRLFMEQKDAEKVIKNDGAIICIYEIMYRIMVKAPGNFTQQDIDALIDEAYSKYPKLPIHSYMIGSEKLKSNNYSESYDWFCKAINLNNQYSELYSNIFEAFIADTYYKLGYISKQQGKLDQALTYYIEAMKVASDKELVTILTGLINIIDDQPQEEVILFLNSIFDMTKKENVECILGALRKTRLHKAFIYYALKYNQEFDGQDETTYIAMILSGQVELAVETAIEASNNWGRKKALIMSAMHDDINAYVNSEKEEYTIISGGSSVEPDAENKIKTMEPYKNWNMDYAVAGILYSKRQDLFDKYKQYFGMVQNEIIMAYLNGQKIVNVTEEINAYFNKLRYMMNFIFEKEEMDTFRNVI